MSPAIVNLLSRLCEHALVGTESWSWASPSKEPVDVPALVSPAGDRAALRADPFTLPFHEIVSFATAPVVALVTQEMGLLENVPAPFARVTLTVVTLVAQPDSCADTADACVPPPTLVRGGENETLADTEHLTDPGAATDCAEELFAAAGFAATNSPEAASSPTANEDHARLVNTLVALAKHDPFTEAPISRIRRSGRERKKLPGLPLRGRPGTLLP